MKILIPVVEFGKAGGFRVLSQLANKWITMGHQVTFITPIANIFPYFPTNAEIIWVDTNGKACSKNMVIDVRQFSLIQRFKALYFGMNKLKTSYDIILANHSLTTYPIIFSTCKGKRFYYIQAYEPEYYQSFKGVKNVILTFLSWLSYFFKFKKIVNADLYRDYKNIRSDMVVYPGIDLEIFKPRPYRHHTKTILGSIGRSEAYKGTSYVLDAFFLAYKENPNIELNIAFGDKSLENIHEAIKVTNPKNDLELSCFYNSLDILIAAGTVQLGAIHYPVIEAMACGISIINTGYFPSTKDNSWIVPVKDANAIALSISTILSNIEVKDIKIENAYKSIGQFSWEIVAQKMDLYFKTN